MYPTKQITVAEMWIKLQQTWAVFKQATSEARLDPSKNDRLRAYAAQYTVMENANEMCRLALRTCGGQSMLKSLPRERLYRDSRLGSLMLPWTAELFRREHKPARTAAVACRRTSEAVGILSFGKALSAWACWPRILAELGEHQICMSCHALAKSRFYVSINDYTNNIE